MTANEQLERILERGRSAARRELGPEDAERLDARARARIAPLQDAAPRLRDRVNRGLFALAVPLLAVYRALRLDLGLEEAPALRLAGEMLEVSFMAAFTPLKRAVFSLGMDLVPLRNLVIRRTLAVREPEGFQFERASLGAAAFGFDVKRCAITEYARTQGAPEIVPLICRLDDLMAQHVKHYRLERTGTLGAGAERCDFRYYRKG
ncbi:MAG: L-2-amino-thiazoline-4-carboxylic acid hydrolase [Myxococcales bacterium]|nr:L-2-amino-thiazoline-4-carboxylic acid hydrolase [Myxococcales bacterium]